MPLTNMSALSTSTDYLICRYTHGASTYKKSSCRNCRINTRTHLYSFLRTHVDEFFEIYFWIVQISYSIVIFHMLMYFLVQQRRNLEGKNFTQQRPTCGWCMISTFQISFQPNTLLQASKQRREQLFFEYTLFFYFRNTLFDFEHWGTVTLIQVKIR